jgi:hypothetical protein
MKKTILRFPILLEVSLRQKNTFWADVFENLAYGKAPYGSYVTASSFIVSKNKGREFTYFLGEQHKSADEMGAELIDILSKKMNFMSITDRLVKLEKFREIKEKLKRKLWESSWSDIRRKKSKDQLLEMYVLTLKDKNKISVSSVKSLLSAIVIGLIFKQIDSDNIRMEKGKIVDISNIKVIRKTWTLSTRPKLKEKNKFQIAAAAAAGRKRKSLHELWLKHVH